MVATRRQKPKCLITGGAGFLGRHVVDAVRESFDVTVLDVRESVDPNVRSIVGDIRDLKQVQAACQGIEVVIHTATVAPSAEDSSNKKLAYAVNVQGTENIIKACQEQKVPKLVYTSSASVVFSGQDLNNVDETAPYAASTLDYYTQTKIEAEKLVLAANGEAGLATVALRPSGIFGEWDRLFMPQIVDKAKQGKLKFIIGSGKNLMEWTYAKNVADAHVLAAEKLHPNSKIAGKAYFITNDSPKPFWHFFGDLLEPLGYPRPSIRLPFWPIFLLALLLNNIIVPLLKPIVKIAPSEFTPQRIRIVASNRTLNISRAKRDLGYRPKVSIEEGIARTVAHFQPLANHKEYKKVH